MHIEGRAEELFLIYDRHLLRRKHNLDLNDDFLAEGTSFGAWKMEVDFSHFEALAAIGQLRFEIWCNLDGYI
jgi:hypothetical protein